jgi:8-oxo-dGTP pyrophosphatase MutT (NUDIX family)
MLRLDPSQPPTEPRAAATLFVVRDSPEGGGLELFFVRRHARSAFLGGAVVFPGGKLDELDRELARTGVTTGPHGRASRFADDPEHGLALAVCACRESLEEAAILPTRPALGADATEALQLAARGGEGLGALLGRLPGGTVLDTAALVPFAHWITPAVEARRYDARFFMTSLPFGQRGRHDTHETVSGVWSSPARMLAAFHGSSDLFLAPPTLRALELLQAAPDAEAALRLCAEQSLAPICPELVSTDPPMLAIPGDPLHTVAERRVAGPTRFVLRDGKLLSEEPG